MLSYKDIFTNEKLDQIFPPGMADQFFEALYGDAAEGAYDISLRFQEATPNALKIKKINFRGYTKSPIDLFLSTLKRLVLRAWCVGGGPAYRNLLLKRPSVEKNGYLAFSNNHVNF